MKNAPDTQFPGFSRSYTKSFFKYPRELEGYWRILTGSEQKILDFILRQTIGYHKTSDAISLDQFVNGIGLKNKGAGISRAQARRAVDSLERKGFITTERTRGWVTTFWLRFRGDEALDGYRPPQHVIYLVSLFRKIDASRVKSFLRDSRELKAMEELAKVVNTDRLEWLITKAIPVTNQKQFMPHITSPSELKEKLAHYEAHISRQGILEELM